MKKLNTLTKINILLAYILIIIILASFGFTGSASFMLVAPLVIMAVGAALKYTYLVLNN